MELRTEVYDRYGNRIAKETFNDCLSIQTASRLWSMAEWYKMRFDDVYFIGFQAITFVPGSDEEIGLDVIAKYENGEVWMSYYYTKYVKDIHGKNLGDTRLMYKPIKKDERTFH
jgi:hypothetical protein